MTNFSRFNISNSNTDILNNNKKKILVFTHILTFSFGVITMHLFMKYQN